MPRQKKPLNRDKKHQGLGNDSTQRKSRDGISIAAFLLEATAFAVFSYHMNYHPAPLKRTSMSLDADTFDSLAMLADKWMTSKSEVIRRAVRKAKEDEVVKGARMTPVQAMEWLQENGISQEQADSMREEVRLEREAKKYWWE